MNKNKEHQLTLLIDLANLMFKCRNKAMNHDIYHLDFFVLYVIDIHTYVHRLPITFRCDDLLAMLCYLDMNKEINRSNRSNCTKIIIIILKICLLLIFISLPNDSAGMWIVKGEEEEEGRKEIDWPMLSIIVWRCNQRDECNRTSATEGERRTFSYYEKLNYWYVLTGL